MAGNTINFELKLNSNIRQQTQEAREFNKTISAAALAAQNIEYGRARGSMGSTGASARDFANQAQGLGGLVRLYATYAANIYAVSAAFNALSTAMNTANMVRGAEQLSSATGVSLALISKQFVNATEGAISFRDAMQAVTKASAAGLASDQILNISRFAQKASQALGLDLNDAVNRLTRGITKLEPELLDELGIFTKIEPAVEAYARGLGRATSSLSDFERRQAFAVAVLKELDEKFGKIQLQSNPYDKLIANLKDLSTSALQLINTVVAPLINFLNSSPVALALAIGLLGKKILGSFIPALKDYNNALESSITKAKDKYEGLNKAASIAAKTRTAELAKEKQRVLGLREDANYAALEAAEKQFSTAAISNLKQRSNVERILKKDIADVTQAEVRYLGMLQKRGIVEKSVADGIKTAVEYNKTYNNLQKQINGETVNRVKFLSAEWFATTKLENARRSLTSRSIVQEAGTTAAETGIRAAISGTISNIREGNLGAVRGTLTGIAAAGGIAAQGVSRLVTALSNVGPYIAAAGAAFQFLSIGMSGNQKETVALTNSLDDLAKNTFTAMDVAKKFEETLTVDSLVAKANAITGLSESVGKVSSNLRNVQDTATIFDKVLDDLSELIGEGLRTKVAKEVAPAVVQGLKLATDPKIRQELQDSIAGILEIKPETAVNVRDVMDAMFRPGGKITAPTRDAENFISVVQQLNIALNRAKINANQAAAPLRSIMDGFKDLQKNYQDLANTFVANDPLTRFAVTLNKQANLINEGFKSTETQLAILKTIAKDPSLLAGFPAETVETFRTAIKQLQDAEADLVKGREAIRIGGAYAQSPTTLGAEGIRQMTAGYRLIDEAQARIKALQDNLQKAIVSAANNAVTLITQRLGFVAKELAIEQQKALVGFLPKSKETVQLTTQLELEGIKLRKEEIEQTRKLLITNDKLRISLEELTLTQERDNPQLQLLAASGDVDANTRLSRIKSSLSNLAQEKLAYTNPAQLESSGQVISPGALAIIGNTAKYQEELIRIAGQQQMTEMKGVIDASNAEFDDRIRQRRSQLEETISKNRELISEQLMLDRSPVEVARARQRFDIEEQRMEAGIKRLEFQKQIAAAGIVEGTAQRLQTEPGANLLILQSIEKAAADAAAKLKEQETSVLNIFYRTNKVALEEQNRAIQADDLLYKTKVQSEEETRRFEKVQQSYALDLLRVEQARQDLNTRKETVGMTEEQFLQETRVLDRRELQLQTAKRIDEIDSQALQKRLDFERQIISLKGTDTQERNRLLQLKAASEEYFQTQKAGEIAIYNQRVRNMEQMQELSARQKAYDEIYKNSFSSLGDAMVTWMQTGKWAGKELFNSLIADLARYELRLQMLQVYGAFRNVLLGVPGGGPAGTPATTPGGTPLIGDFSAGPLTTGAKGLYFNNAMQRFGKGGAFTNSIVNQPTLFKFAKGTGLMGEAGPEAIMPLKRDNQGNLGVRGGGQKTEVVINNYSNQEATAEEITDSRGNRRVEVVIGEVAAGDMSRSGSASQKVMRNTFGLRPRLLRR